MRNDAKMVDDRSQDFWVGCEQILQNEIKVECQDGQRREVNDQVAKAGAEFFKDFVPERILQRILQQYGREEEIANHIQGQENKITGSVIATGRKYQKPG